MHEWSRRVLGVPLYTLYGVQVKNETKDEDEKKDKNPFEVNIDWNLEESSTLKFSFRPNFCSDEFENLLGQRPYFLFDINSNGKIYGRFAVKVSFFYLKYFY